MEKGTSISKIVVHRPREPGDEPFVPNPGTWEEKANGSWVFTPEGQ